MKRVMIGAWAGWLLAMAVLLSIGAANPGVLAGGFFAAAITIVWLFLGES